MDETIIALHMQGPGYSGPLAAVTYLDVYQLCSANLAPVTGLMVAAGCDQIYLASHSDLLTDWVRQGGRLLISGHPMTPIVTGLPQVRRLDYRSLADIWLYSGSEHRIWNGIDRDELLLRTGVPGEHSFQELLKIGVAGFYARAYLGQLPKETTVITTMGPLRLPVDISYPIGAGEVIVHCGNDLTSFQPELTEQVLDYLAGAR